MSSKNLMRKHPKFLIILLKRSSPKPWPPYFHTRFQKYKRRSILICALRISLSSSKSVRVLTVKFTKLSIRRQVLFVPSKFYRKVWWSNWKSRKTAFVKSRSCHVFHGIQTSPVGMAPSLTKMLFTWFSNFVLMEILIPKWKKFDKNQKITKPKVKP